MKKIITQSKWDKLFEETQNGLGYHKENGDWITEPEELDEWFNRLDKLQNDYIVIGLRIIFNYFRNIFHKHEEKED